jgi:hypothetical protein
MKEIIDALHMIYPQCCKRGTQQRTSKTLLIFQPLRN